ncbi:MAG: chorismate mutase [Hyphomonadaceae bacterium]|nr:chorismate mutase [Hyphomonadaceae bacterium]
MNDQSPPGSPLETIRTEIDGIDKQLLALFAERLRAIDKLAGLKPSESGLPIRPGREVAMLRRLVAEAPAPLDRDLVVELWRAMIAASLRRQRMFDVVVGGGRGDPTRLFDIARRHFGARTRIKDLGEPQAALQKAAENPDSVVAVTSWPAAPGVGAWWPALSERRFHNLHIIAGLPLLGGTDEPEAAVFAASQTEEAGNDVTILIAFDPHHRLQRALNETGLTGRELARAEPRVLVRVDGFIGLDDPRAAAMSRAGLDSVRVLGSYARV